MKKSYYKDKRMPEMVLRTKQPSKHEPVLTIYCSTESDTEAILARRRAGYLIHRQN